MAHAGTFKWDGGLLPAGRGEVFAQFFSVGDDETVTELDKPAHLSPQRMVERYAHLKSLKWAGSGSQLQRTFLEQFAQQNEIVLWSVQTSQLLPTRSPAGASGNSQLQSEPRQARGATRTGVFKLTSSSLHNLSAPSMLDLQTPK